jgi:hypothetical protein
VEPVVLKEEGALGWVVRNGFTGRAVFDAELSACEVRREPKCQLLVCMFACLHVCMFACCMVRRGRPV